MSPRQGPCTAVQTVVVGAGHAGLAVSRLLTDAGREHVVLERGRLGERWRSARWDSLHLLSPNWSLELPSWDVPGDDPDGFMAAGQLVGWLDAYAASFSAPIQDHTDVESVSAAGTGGYVVRTDHGELRAAQVVIATGTEGTPFVPPALRERDDGVRRLPPLTVLAPGSYRSPWTLPDGGVLVVGASASGVQIAEELARAGRDVMLSVGRHTRMPRGYRGMDAYYWLDRTGRWARTVDQLHDVATARRDPSLQLTGPRGHGRPAEDIDLNSLQRHGVRLVGRLVEVDAAHRARFADDLVGTVSDADERLTRLLDSLDAHIETSGLGAEVLPVCPPSPVALPAQVPTRVDLRARGIRTVILASGYRPCFPWLRVPVLDRTGAIDQYRGRTAAPGLYVVGQRFQHRRDSATIAGARYDAADVVAHLLAADGTRPMVGSRR